MPWPSAHSSVARILQDAEEHISAQAKQIATANSCIANNIRAHIAQAREIEKLTAAKELAEAGCVARADAIKWALWLLAEDHNRKDLARWASGQYDSWGDPPEIIDRLQKATVPNPGHALAAELAQLRRLDAALQDDTLIEAVYQSMDCRNHRSPGDVMRAYRAALNAKKEAPDAKA